MLSTSAKVALTAILGLSIHLHAVSAQTTTASAMPVLASQGCFSSSGDLVDQGSYTWQTSSYCQKVCLKLGKPVLGLNDGGNCWCGNLLPAANTKVSDSQCNSECDGYNKDDCGGSDTWTIMLTGLSSNVGSSDGSSSSSSTSSSSSSILTSSNTNAASTTVVSTSAAIASSSTATISSSTTSTTSTPVTFATSAATTATPSSSTGDSTIIQTVTVGGSVQTIGTTIVAATDATATSSATAKEHEASSGPNKAGIAAGVVVGILAIAAIVAGVVLFLKRRSKKASEGSLRRHSSLHAWTGGAGRGAGIAAGVRASNVNDSRLDPNIMVERRQSSGSVFADNQDYSRRILTVTNPDGS